jgi:hypothetical protein
MEEDAARACSKYLKDGITPVKYRAASTSQFMGVHWNKSDIKWRAKCRGKQLGNHTKEEDAARAYNVEAERLGRPLNVIPPAGAAGTGAGPRAGGGAGVGAGGSAGPKRAAPKTQATPATCTNTKRAAPTTLATPTTNKIISM